MLTAYKNASPLGLAFQAVRFHLAYEQLAPYILAKNVTFLSICLSIILE